MFRGWALLGGLEAAPLLMGHSAQRGTYLSQPGEALSVGVSEASRM